MNEVTLTSIDIDEAMSTLSEHLNAKVDKENNEACLEIPETWGKGHINSFSFSNGLEVIDIDVRLEKDLTLKFNNSTVRPLKLIYNREEAVKHQFTEEPSGKTMKGLECLMVAADVSSNQSILIEKQKSVCLFIISINRRTFESKIEDFLPGMNKDLEKLFRDVNGVNRFYYKGYYSLDIAEGIESFNECDLTDFPKSVFLEGKVHEILGHQLRQYLDDGHSPDKRKILRSTTLTAIKEAAVIVEEELEQVDNILKLAKRVGLNQNTLQQGFKHVYGKSVNAFIKELRLKRAKELLETSALNITQVSYAVGINSRSYFSKIFKEKYGMTPKQFVLNTRNKAS